MYEVDLIGGPEDGNSYVFPDTPTYLYFPYLTVPVGMMWTDDHTITPFNAPKLVYKHIMNGLYLYQGIQD